MKDITYNFLIVDDNMSSAFLNKTIINKSSSPKSISLAKNGKEALDIIQKSTTPLFIFLDINMPVMDGWEFLENYEELNVKYKKNIIVLMVSEALTEEKNLLLKTKYDITIFNGKILNTEFLNSLANTIPLLKLN